MSGNLYELLKVRNNFVKYKFQWDIRKSPGCGHGLFATSQINEGQVIFRDVPIVIGPRSSRQYPACVVCLQIDKPLFKCSKNCHLPVCSLKCENDISHQKECELLRKILVEEDDHWSLGMYKMLMPVRCLFMNDIDRQIVKQLHCNPKGSVQKQMVIIKRLFGNVLSEEDLEWIEHCCGVLDGTAFEIEKSNSRISWSLRGLYPLSSMMNHSCSPNTRHYYTNDESSCTMCVVATKPIDEGEEITTQYCPLLWATAARQFFLGDTKHFRCSCPRCQDPTEFGTYLSAVLCHCQGMILPISPLDLSTIWKCDKCLKIITAKEVTIVQSIAVKLPPKDMDLILPPTNALKIQLKLEHLKGMDKNKLSELSVEQLNFKEQLIKDILSVIIKLQLGESRMKGLLLFDLFKTLKIKHEKGLEINTEEMNDSLFKARRILKHDTTAPNTD